MFVCLCLHIQSNGEGMIKVGDGNYIDFHVYNLCSI